MDMKCLVIFKVEVTDLAIVVLCNLVLLQIAELIEQAAAIGKRAQNASVLGGGRRFSTIARRGSLVGTVLSDEILVSRSNGRAAEGCRDWPTTAGGCKVPRHSD